MSNFALTFVIRSGRGHQRIRWIALALLLLVTAGLKAIAQDPAVAVRSRKAMLVVETVIHYEGETRGMGRSVLEGLLQQCNGIRQGIYKLPAQTLPEEILHVVDTTRQESSFDGTGYALSLDIVRGVDLPDVHRWTKEAATGNGYPATAPDCATYQRYDSRNGFLWRAGKRYSLDYQRKRAVLEPSRAIDVAPVPGAPSVVGSSFPQDSVAGQRCSVSGPLFPFAGNMMGTREQCIWNDFGTVVWMNLPLALRRTVQFGAAKKQINESVAQTADPNPSFSKDTFEFPAGFTVVERH